MTRSLVDHVFRPRSIALIGASSDPKKTSSRPLRFLDAAGFAGGLQVVHPRQSEVFGRPAVPSVADLPEVPDHAFILLNTAGALEAVEQCAARNVPIVTVLANGFSEAGADGAAREARLRDMLQGTDTRLIGPNSLGVVNTHNGMVLTANAAFDRETLLKGRLMLASQSGSMLGAILSRAQSRGIGFSRLVSVGNEADIDAATLCEASLDDPEVEGFLLFLETVRNGQALARFADAAYQRGKPVLAYKLGRSEAGQQLAVSHTGALLAEDDTAAAFMREVGIARVEMFESLFEAASLFCGWRPTETEAPRVGVVTTTGGGAATVVDRLGLSGVAVAQASQETRDRLAATGIDADAGLILDLTLAGADYDKIKRALDVLRRAPEFDLLLVVVGSSARFMPEQSVAAIVDGEDRNKPICAFLVPEAPEGLQMLAAAGIPAFRTPEVCADAIAAFVARRKPRISKLGSSLGEVATHTLSEEAAAQLFAKRGINPPPQVMLDPREKNIAPLPFTYPVAAKMISERIAHKTEAGGVLLDIGNDDELVRAFSKIAQTVRQRTGVEVDRVVVSPMIRPLQEVLLGYRNDPQVGPVVLLAPGGVLAEMFDERAIRLAPVDRETARGMIDELKCLAPLRGYRGSSRGDIEALTRAIVSFSELALEEASPFQEAEINPLAVMPEGEGVVALDALAVIAGAHKEEVELC